MSHNILTNHVAAPTVTQVCNHKTHGLRFVFCSGTKHKSESLFLCFKYELQVRLVCNQHLLSWKHTACLETLVYQKFLTIYGSFKGWKLSVCLSLYVCVGIWVSVRMRERERERERERRERESKMVRCVGDSVYMWVGGRGFEELRGCGKGGRGEGGGGRNVRKGHESANCNKRN